MSVLIEENNTLKSTLKDEVGELREWQSDINRKLEEIEVNQNVSNISNQLKVIESERESEKKRINVIHNLVKEFSSNLVETEQNFKQSIQEVQEDVQSIRENICEMLTEVPQVTMSSLETRFCNIDLTPMQRLHLRKLVNEKKKRNCIACKNNQDPDWIIRSGKLCRKSDYKVFDFKPVQHEFEQPP